MDHSVSPPAPSATSRADHFPDWAKTVLTALLVFPLPTLLLFAAFTMPGMP